MTRDVRDVKRLYLSGASDGHFSAAKMCVLIKGARQSTQERFLEGTMLQSGIFGGGSMSANRASRGLVASATESAGAQSQLQLLGRYSATQRSHAVAEIDDYWIAVEVDKASDPSARRHA